MRAQEPSTCGQAVNPRDGVRLQYEVFGDEHAPRTVLCLPTWSLVHSRVWKMQVPFLARLGYRVVTFDGRGNGRSGRPETGYEAHDFAADAIAVMDRVGADTSTLLAFSAGCRWAAVLAVEHSTRVDGLTLVAPSVTIGGPLRRLPASFTEAPPDREGWNKFNAVHWREDLPDFRRWFAERIFTEPHSTKGQDDIVAWSDDITPEMLTRTMLDSGMPWMRELWPRIGQPLLVVHGDEDEVTALSNTEELLAHLPHGELAVFEGSGHAPHLRDPVRFNLLLRSFLERMLPLSAGSPANNLVRSTSWSRSS